MKKADWRLDCPVNLGHFVLVVVYYGVSGALYSCQSKRPSTLHVELHFFSSFLTMRQVLCSVSGCHVGEKVRTTTPEIPDTLCTV